MRFIPAVSGVQIPPLLPEHDRKPGNFPGFFCYGFSLLNAFRCRITARLLSVPWARGRRLTGSPGKDVFAAESFPNGDWYPVHHGNSGMSENGRGLRQGRGDSAALRTGCALWGGFSALPGENAENTCQRGASSVDASLCCGKSTDALWQGSSVGQSMRFIPAVSGVQIPPLLPENKKSPR